MVTTHSPLLLGEVPARCVRFLEFIGWQGEREIPSEAYGMDANRILQEFMDAPVRNRQVDDELKALFELIDQEHFDEARTAIADLERKLGSDDTRADPRQLVNSLSGRCRINADHPRKGTEPSHPDATPEATACRLRQLHRQERLAAGFW